MTIKEFCKQGYSITATETVQEIRTINLKDFQNHKSLEDCDCRVDEYTPTNNPIIYDIFEPEGNQITPYETENGLTSEKAVHKFIENLSERND